MEKFSSIWELACSPPSSRESSSEVGSRKADLALIKTSDFSRILVIKSLPEYSSLLLVSTILCNLHAAAEWRIKHFRKICGLFIVTKLWIPSSATNVGAVHKLHLHEGGERGVTLVQTCSNHGKGASRTVMCAYLNIVSFLKITILSRFGQKPVQIP